MGAEAVPPVRVLVVDDQAMIRTGLAMIVDHEPDLLVVGEAGDGATAVAAATRLAPDVVLMDVRMPGVDGVEATRRIRADPALEGVRVAVLTTFDDPDLVAGALRAGADAFLLKDTDPGTLVAAVRTVHGGGSVLDPAVTPFVVRQWREAERAAAAAGGPSGDARWAAGVAALTAREREVLRAVARGASNADVAAALGVTAATVKSHVHALLGKLGCRSRAQLVAAAYESGAVVPGGAG
ncbi:response regulator [Cellulomonas endophytica]|uniref:response regulator n=1 Tax=Cellulomonas endophytica TaxID=2494735 RepID=UPI001F0BBD2D|nr:response regulator transcription factor [Cellulomonas endophytica]